MENQKLIAPKTEKEVINSDLGQLSLIQYYQIYRFSVSSKIRDRINCGWEELQRVED